ncbi:hypothetical protein MRBLRC7O_000876 [Agrobacterium radiobacter]|uniref:hypothetical protein n=1 Tax=Agrobacterium radiobacter TaxID=362 RepID=UPI003467B69B
MTALEEIKKALEGVTPGPWESKIDAQFYFSIFAGDFKVFTARDILADRGYANARYIAAVNPEAISELLSTLESLQAKNEGLLRRAATAEKKLRGANAAFERERKLHLQNQQLNRTLEARAEAAEAEVKRLKTDRPYIIGFNDGWEAAVGEPPEDASALASTGGEHHAE